MSRYDWDRMREEDEPEEALRRAVVMAVGGGMIALIALGLMYSVLGLFGADEEAESKASGNLVVAGKPWSKRAKKIQRRGWENELGGNLGALAVLSAALWGVIGAEKKWFGFGAHEIMKQLAVAAVIMLALMVILSL